ncbi:MAG: DNA repair protein RadC [Bacteroidetes bacterium]|nr:DNA repair protein RadC [Bacteroidota bacterium]
MEGRSVEKECIKQWAVQDRPREKFAVKGAGYITDAELLAIIIAAGYEKQSALELAQTILRSVGNSLSGLSRLGLQELLSFRGIGYAKAIAILASIELGRRRQSDLYKRKRSKIWSSFDAYMILKPLLAELSHEEFWLLYLNRRSEVFQYEQLSKGGLSSTIVDPKILFRGVLQAGASGLILVHNHPSGNTLPSPEDKTLTRQLMEGGRILEIDIIDHIIIGNTSYYSFADEGHIAPRNKNDSTGYHYRGKASDHQSSGT